MLVPEGGGMAVETARRIAKNASALILVRDESVREIVATALAQTSAWMVSRTGSVAEARAALRREPEVLVLGPSFRDREIEELLAELSEAAPAIVLLVTAAAAGRLVLHYDVVAIEAPFELDRLSWAIDEAVRRKRDFASGTIPTR